MFYSSTVDKADNTPVKGVQENKNQKDIPLFSLKGKKIVWIRQSWKLTLNKIGIKSNLKSISMEAFESYKSTREPCGVVNLCVEAITY